MAASVFDPPRAPHIGAYPGYWHEMYQAIGEAISRGQAGPCSKSKRIAWAQSPAGTYPARFAVNQPPVGLACAGDDACRDVCGKICTPAEETRVLDVLRAPIMHEADDLAVFHLEIVGGVPQAFDRPGKPQGPSCITCARIMVQAGVRAVWLFGVDGWRWWRASDFWVATVRELRLVPRERLAVLR